MLRLLRVASLRRVATAYRTEFRRSPPIAARARYGPTMGRKVALVGVALATVGILILLWAQPAPQVSATVPIDRLVNVVLSFLPLTGAMCASVGGLMIGLAIVAMITGHLPVRGNPPALLWLGLAAVVLASVIEVGLMGVLLDGAPPSGLLAVLHATGVVRTIGAALLAWWLTAQLTGFGSSRSVNRGASAEGASASR